MARSQTRDTSRDNQYFDLFIKPIRLCARYKPKFGRGGDEGLTVSQFQELYRSDPFYNWIGLDSALVYAAHKAAGGLTSIYRQIGIGCQFVFKQVLMDSLHLTEEQSAWSYKLPATDGKSRKLALDGRIEFDDLGNPKDRKRVESWVAQAQEKLGLDAQARKGLKGVVFEVRQGYKSMDSKRQNADISNAASAYAHHYIPILLLLSTQIDQMLVQPYSQAFWVLLKGTKGGPPTESTYAFCSDILGYDLAGFFERNSGRIKKEIERTVSTLLKP